MSYSISEHILKETTKCKRDFACLKTGQCEDKPNCEVESINGQNVLFLKSTECFVCPYWVPFGFSKICSCPTHYAIQKTVGQ